MLDILCKGLKHPLDEEQQHESRHPQDAHHQGVPQVHPKGDPGEAGGQLHHPQCQKAQQCVRQQPQRHPEGSAEHPQQGDDEKAGQNGGDDLLIQVHAASPSCLTAAAVSGLRSLIARIR